MFKVLSTFILLTILITGCNKIEYNSVDLVSTNTVCVYDDYGNRIGYTPIRIKGPVGNNELTIEDKHGHKFKITIEIPRPFDEKINVEYIIITSKE